MIRCFSFGKSKVRNAHNEEKQLLQNCLEGMQTTVTDIFKKWRAEVEVSNLCAAKLNAKV